MSMDPNIQNQFVSREAASFCAQFAEASEILKQLRPGLKRPMMSIIIDLKLSLPIRSFLIFLLYIESDIITQRYCMQQFPDFPFQAGKYLLDDPQFLGEGSYGKVYKIKHKATNEEIALKQINMEKLQSESLINALVQEAKLMSELKSPQTVTLYEYYIGKRYSYMILQLCDSDLRKMMDSRDKIFPEEQCIKIFTDIINAYHVLCENSCIHRDIKPDNILVKNGMFKIGDFGFACTADLYGLEKLDEICGTPIYMAPQLLRNETYTAKCDIWSLGIMFYELLYGYLPWPMKCPQSYLKSIKRKPLAFPFDIKISRDTKDLLRKCLKESEEERISWEQFYQHPLIAKAATGEPISTYVKPKVRNILASMQRETEQKFIDQKQIFRKYQNLSSLNKQQFSCLLQSLNPTITTAQIGLLFEVCDENRNGMIERAEFEQFFSSVDYRDDPSFHRELEELVGIIIARGLNAEQIFDQADKNHTGALDSGQFKELVIRIAPKLKAECIGRLYSKFDKNKNGLVEKKEFLRELGAGVLDTKHYTGKWYERVERNLKTLRIWIQDQNMTIQKVLDLSDINRDSHIDHNEFRKLVNYLQYQISEEEIKDIFKMLDENHSGSLNVREILSLVQ